MPVAAAIAATGSSVGGAWPARTSRLAKGRCGRSCAARSGRDRFLAGRAATWKRAVDRLVRHGRLAGFKGHPLCIKRVRRRRRAGIGWHHRRRVGLRLQDRGRAGNHIGCSHGRCLGLGFDLPAGNRRVVDHRRDLAVTLAGGRLPTAPGRLVRCRWHCRRQTGWQTDCRRLRDWCRSARKPESVCPAGSGSGHVCSARKSGCSRRRSSALELRDLPDLLSARAIL